jgi:hypothetical protein
MNKFRGLLFILSIIFFTTAVYFSAPTRAAASGAQVRCFKNPDDAVVKALIYKRGGHKIFMGINDADSIIELFIIPNGEWMVAFRKPNDIFCPITWGTDAMLLSPDKSKKKVGISTLFSNPTH